MGGYPRGRRDAAGTPSPEGRRKPVAGTLPEGHRGRPNDARASLRPSPGQAGTYGR